MVASPRQTLKGFKLWPVNSLYFGVPFTVDFLSEITGVATRHANVSVRSARPRNG